MFSYSSYNKQEVPGECTEEALNARDVRWAKQRPLREPKERAPVKDTGVPAEDGEDLGIEYRSVPNGSAQSCCPIIIHFQNPTALTVKVLFQLQVTYVGESGFHQHTNLPE